MSEPLAPHLVEALGDELHAALRTRVPVEPLTSPGRGLALTIDDAYGISRRILARRQGEGERLVGKKIGVTSKAVQRMLDVHQPDFGFLTNAMRVDEGVPVPVSRELIQPRAEGEIAFVLERDLVGPGVTEADVIAATASVHPCFEIVDSRVRDWKIRIEDTVADNASSGLFVVAREGVDPKRPGGVDLVTCGMVVEKNGEIVSTGAGAAALGSPVYCVAWLANTLGRYGIPLVAGEVILSGSLVPLEPVRAGDRMRLRIGGLGALSVEFS